MIKKRKLKLGFIGAGFIGQLAHIENFNMIDDCELYALAELRPQLREKVGKRYGFKKTYSNHFDLLQDKDVEAVIVVTQRPVTGPITYDCLNAGKHVLTEKPMAHTVKQAKKLVELAEKNKLIYSVGFMKRYDEGVKFAKRIIGELLESNELGALIFARGHCFMGDSYCNCDGHEITNEVKKNNCEPWPIAPDWLHEEYHQKYARFLNVYSHNINLLRFLSGEMPSVEYANLDNINGQVTVLQFSNYSCTLETGQYNYRNWDEITEFYFEKGKIKIETPPALLRNVPASIEIYKGNDKHTIISPQLEWKWSFRNQAIAFKNSILHCKESITSGKDSINDLILISDIWEKNIQRLKK